VPEEGTCWQGGNGDEKTGFANFLADRHKKIGG